MQIFTFTVKNLRKITSINKGEATKNSFLLLTNANYETFDAANLREDFSLKSYCSEDILFLGPVV